MRPGTKTTSTANRAAVSKVSTAWACCRQRQRTCEQRALQAHGGASAGNRHCAATGFVQNETAGSARGSKGGRLLVVDRQSVQHRRIGIEDQHANVGERGQVQHLHEGFRHALGRILAVLLHQPLGGDAFDRAQVLVGPGVAISFNPTAGLYGMRKATNRNSVGVAMSARLASEAIRPQASVMCASC